MVKLMIFMLKSLVTTNREYNKVASIRNLIGQNPWV